MPLSHEVHPMRHELDLTRVRERFPALARRIHGRPAAYLDGPAGTQVPRVVIDAVGAYLAEHNANSGGVFPTSRETDAMLREAHGAAADFLGAEDPETVVFGPNMTTLTLAVSRALARTWKAGDEVVVSRLDHDANVTPWVLAARDAGVTVREIAIRTEDCTLDLEDLASKLGERTRLVAVGAASNAVGTLNPVREIVTRAHGVGAQVFIDAVHLGPHLPIDVAAWDCDFLACSAYKFFGPHVGLLWGRRESLEQLPVYKLRASPDGLPHRWHTGTENFEGIAGTMAAIDYLAGLGGPGDRRAALLRAFDAIREHERGLAGRLLRGLSELGSVKVWGIRDPARLDERVPTVSFTHARLQPRAVAEALAAQGIFVWHGNFYALPVTESLDLEPDGMVRVGLVHYNTAEEVDRLLEALRGLD